MSAIISIPITISGSATPFQYIAGSTNGQAVAYFPATKTTDHWLVFWLQLLMKSGRVGFRVLCFEEK
jgi:hypothetical protein